MNHRVFSHRAAPFSSRATWVLGAIAILAGPWSAAPAAAGTWSVTYTVLQNSKVADGNPSNLVAGDPLAPTTNLSGKGQYSIVGTLQCQATLTWTPDAGNPHDVAPPKVVVWEYGIAAAHSMDGAEPGYTGSADNGLGHTVATVQANDGKHTTSEGHKAERVVATNGQNTIVLPAVTLTASAQKSTTTTGHVSVNFSYEAYVENRYVSSTNVVQRLELPRDFGGAVSSFRVELNGELVLNSPAGGGPVLDPRTTAKHVAFASTKVKDGDRITLKTIAVNTVGKTYTWENIFIAYNQYTHSEALDFLRNNQSETISSIANVKDSFAAMKHVPVPGDPGAFQKTPFLEVLKHATVVSVQAHGFGGGLSELREAVPGNTASNAEISTHVRRASWIPALNIVYAGSCSTQSTGVVSAFFGGNPGTNQAYVGYNRDARIDGMPMVTGRFWALIKLGRTAGAAVSQSWRDHRTAVRTGNKNRKFRGFQVQLENAGLELSVTGDSAARLVGVYGVINSDRWWRVY